MSFIVAAASTAAVSAISAGAITGGVAGALGGVAAGTAGAGLAAAGGIAAGAATGAALGAGVGAIGAGITGGDVGEGALSGAVSGAVTGGIAPGLGGATAGLGTIGSGIATGGVAGAAGSAAGAAATGKDAGEAALMGGGIGAAAGGLGGAMKADVPVPSAGGLSEGATKGISAANAESLMPAPQVSSYTPKAGSIAEGFANAPNLDQGVTTIPTSTGASNLTTAYDGKGFNPTDGSPAAEMAANAAKAPITMSDRLNLAGDAFKGGMSAIKAEPMRAASGLIGGLAAGADAGGGFDAPELEEKPKYKMRPPAGMSKNYTPYYVDPTTYYAGGGIIGGLPGAGILKPVFDAGIGGSLGIKDTLFGDGKKEQEQAPEQQAAPAPDAKMNPFASMGVQAAQIGQQTFEQQQAQAQQAQQPQVQQGIVPPKPIPQQPQMQQPQMQRPMFYADGGAVNVGGQDSFAQAASNGGIMQDNLGGYSHGGIAGLTKGPGDGVSDDIPAQIGNSGKQPARLADGEFVIPSRIVSELGNGSTEAGAKALQAMVDRVQAGRKKSTGKGKVAVDSKARKSLLA